MVLRKKALEFCVTDFDGAKIAAENGVDRIELCVDLAVGGLTPSAGLMEACASIIETHVLIRPRAGDFNYSEKEIEIMQADFMQASLAGATGVVFGCLDENKELDLEKNIGLLSFAETLQLATTFHRAFDQVKSPIKAFNQLIEWEVDRLLTSGQGKTASAGIELIQQLIKVNKEKTSERLDPIQIMVGAGINPRNADLFLNMEIDALHCSIHKKNTSSQEMGERLQYDLEKIKAMKSFFN